MKITFLSTLLAFLSFFSVNAENKNIANLITSSDWNTIFPNRAQAGHAQGATDDFYSYDKFISAVDEISEYSVTFSLGPDGQGTSVAVTKSDGSSWTYVISGSSWSGDDYTVDYSTFCNTGNDFNDKRELAAFFANITKETTGGWKDPDPSKGPDDQEFGSHGTYGLYWLRELRPGNASGSLKPTACYTTGSTDDYSPVPGKCYYGRGPIQMSYYYNYGNFSEFLYNNTNLVSNPDLVEQDGKLAFLSAIWFWMTPQCPKPSCHQVMQEIYDESATSYFAAKMSKKGFLHTVNIINGSVECRSGVSDVKPVLRSKLYRYYMSVIGFTTSEIANEDIGEYETLCNESSGAMLGYTSCDFQNVIINNCSAPALGKNKELSSGSASLDANLTLKAGESIAWYKDGILVSGATETTYTATEAGVFKAIVTGIDCTKEDQIEIFNEGEGPSCSKPALGDDVELSGGSASLNANIILKDGETITWYKNNSQIWGISTTTYTATEVGTYKAVVTGIDCSEEDEMVVSAEVITCSEPDLGSDKSFSGDPVILDANIELKWGETITWYKDGGTIWGSNQSTYTTNTPGTYKIVVSGEGCTEEDEIVVTETTCSAPTLGKDKELSSGSASLDANVALEDDETITWYKDDVLISGATGTTYTTTEAGIYKAVITGTDCTNEDQIEIFNEGEGPSCSKPALGDDLELSGGSAALNANITLQDGETITWYKDNSQIWGTSTTTYTATGVGTYKVVVTGTDCSEEDEIVVSEEVIVCSKPDLGGDKSFSGDPVILDANITLKSGESTKWYKDEVQLWSASGTTHTTSELGTYKVVVVSGPSWAPVCTEEDEVQVIETTCSAPVLGNDIELFGGSASLDANVILEIGETIAWYIDDVLISGETETTYMATESGVYKAIVTGTDCASEDQIEIFNEGEGSSCSKPGLGDDVELSGGSTALNANITLKEGETITWYKNNSQIWGTSTTTYTATTAGTYKVVVTGAECSEEDEIVVSEEVIICSKPDLGGDKSFSEDPVILDANITLKSGESIKWYKDDEQIWSASGTTYTVTELGTYKVVVVSGPNWAPTCTEEDEVQVLEATCSAPEFGNDISLCQETSVTLDANLILEPGESLKWYKDNAEIEGANESTYSTDAVGTYKAEVTKDFCVRSDEIIVSDGGAQTLDIEASNEGVFCSISATTEVTLTVTGGDGEYEFYDVPTKGEALGTGASFVVNSDLVEDGETKTFYVQEPSGPPTTVGATEAYEQSSFKNFTSDDGWNDHRMVFNTFDDLTLESIDFVFDNKTSGPYTITVTIYEYGTNTVVETKQVELNSDDIATSDLAPYPLNTAELGIELLAGNYEMSFIGSTFFIQVTTSGLDYSNSSYASTGIAEITGVSQPFATWNYPEVIQSTHVGAYNWVFKKGGAGVCGRASVEVKAECGITTNSKEIVSNEIAVFPNPASDVININLGNIHADNSFIELYSSIGQLVMSQNIRSVSGNMTQFETADLDGGLYFVKVIADTKIYTTSVVITK